METDSVSIIISTLVIPINKIGSIKTISSFKFDEFPLVLFDLEMFYEITNQ